MAAEGAFAEALVLLDDQDQARPLRIAVLLNSVRLLQGEGRLEEMADAVDYVVAELEGLPDGDGKARQQLTLGQLLQQEVAQGNHYWLAQAHASLSEALAISEGSKELTTRSNAEGLLAALYQGQGRSDEARTLLRRADFHARQADAPELLYRWQWQQALLDEAAGDRAAAIEGYKAAIDTLHPIRNRLFLGYRTSRDVFNERIKPVYLGLARLLLEQSDEAVDEAQRQALILAARATMERIKAAELEDFFKDECATGPVRQAQGERIEAGTAILYPIVFKQSVSLLLSLPDGVHHQRIEVDSPALLAEITRLRRQLQTRTDNGFLITARSLHQKLIAPIESKLREHQVETLVVAPDGILRLVPFATLHDGDRYLIERYALATIPAISLTDPAPMASERSILLSGLSEGVQGFSPLPSVTAELRDVKTIMDGRLLYQNQEHNEARLREAIAEQPYAIVHLATHGIFGGSPEETFLLTYDDRLNMNELESLIGLGRYRDQKVELLTLSACQTALGDERAALGLAGAAVKAGVRSVVATLWYVDDEATSLAIREFYRQLTKPELSRAQALRRAQLSLIQQKRYRHPLYWAPFLLIGDWT